MLYLSDNLLTTLDNSTFEDLDELETLDLSLNGISKMAPVIFHLPSLKRLYLSQNQNINIAEVIEETKPITSPLDLLDISFNELEELPKVGVLPQLLLYNISGNNLLNMQVADIAGLCNLHTLANQNFSAYFDELCDCWNLQRWLDDRNVRYSKFDCHISENGILLIKV